MFDKERFVIELRAKKERQRLTALVYNRSRLFELDLLDTAHVDLSKS